MFDFEYLNKEQKNEYLPILFDILYSNMKDIAPSGLLYDNEKTEFLREVSPALDKEPRKVILCYCDGGLVGFLMYYTRENLLMIEELQLVKKYQRTRLFYRLCKHMIEILPDNIEFIESFVHKGNANSLSLQKWLGMEVIDTPNDKLLHLCGSAKTFKRKIR